MNGGLVQPPSLPSFYLGQVATRAYAPNNVAATSRSINFQSFHFARDDITAIAVEDGNWYADLTTPFEHNPGATPTYTRYIQYPIGSSWQRFSYSSASSYTFADGETKLSDMLTLATRIPKGAAFMLGVHVESANGVVVYNYPNQNFQTAGNNNPAVATQIWDASGTLAARADYFATNGSPAATSASVQNAIMPTAIVAYTRNPSIYIFGNSRDYGTGDRDAAGFVDGTGDTGNSARSLGRFFGYINCATSGDKLQNWLTAHTKRSKQAQYCTHISGPDLINDVNGSRTAAQMATDLGTMLDVADFAGKKVWLVTTGPNPDSTNATPNTNDAARTGINDKIRSGQIRSAGNIIPAGFWDIASIEESAHNSGLWDTINGHAITDTNAPLQLHNNMYGYLNILRSRIVDSARVVR